MFTYQTTGVCAKQIDLELNGDYIESVVFHGGCPGNLKAIQKLVTGMHVSKVQELLEGNTCGTRTTSCTDQLVQAILAAKAQN